MEFLHVVDLLFPGWNTVKLDKERFDKEQIGVKVPFPMSSLPIYFTRIRNNFRVTNKFLITKFDCNTLGLFLSF